MLSANAPPVPVSRAPQFLTPLQTVNVWQPQNTLPAFTPRLVVRLTMRLAHKGQAGELVAFITTA